MHMRPRHITEQQWQQIPVPRRYQCLALQFNVTFYPLQKNVRTNFSLRDPIEQYDLIRERREAEPWHWHTEWFLDKITGLYKTIEDITEIHEPF